MSFSYVIWDFNGTIVNDAPLSLSAINKVLKKRKLREIPGLDEYREAFCFPIEKYYAGLGLDFSREPYKIPADEWVSLYREGINDLKLTDGVAEVIEQLKKMGIGQMVLSASEKTMLLHQLDLCGLTGSFETILGTDDVYGGGKIELAKNWAKKTGTDLSDAVFIGDTDHDYYTSVEIGCQCILYSGGHMSRRALSQFGVPVVDKINEIIKYF